MGGEYEAAGDIATGALLARTVDRRGGAADRNNGQGVCLNCGTALFGAHCHACGQAGHVHRSLGAIGHELLHGVVHFEGKLWKTLPMLAFQPGALTRRYIDGERARFVSPMALFLFSVFTLFAVLSILGIAPPAEVRASTGQVAAGMTEVRNDMVEARQREIRRRDDPAATAQERAKANETIAELDDGIRMFEQTTPVLTQRAGQSDTIKTGWTRLDYGIKKMKANPGLALYKLQANSYKFSWLLIPLSVPFVWLMFAWRREFRAYDHAVFVTYSIAFMSLLFIALTILGAAGVSTGVLATIAFLIPPFHIYRQLRGGYRLRRSSALARTVFLLVAVQIIAALFLMLVMGLGLVG